MKTDQNRKEFEEWLSKQTWISHYDISGDAAWEAWQAARESLNKYEEALGFLASQGCCWRNLVLQ